MWKVGQVMSVGLETVRSDTGSTSPRAGYLYACGCRQPLRWPPHVQLAHAALAEAFLLLLLRLLLLLLWEIRSAAVLGLKWPELLWWRRSWR